MKITALIAVCLCMTVGLALGYGGGYAYVPAYNYGGQGMGNSSFLWLIGLLFLITILFNPNINNTTSSGSSVTVIGG